MLSLSTHNLCIGYPPKKIHQHLNLELYSGEFTCLLGQNGAGKSTLMRTLAGFQPAISGEVRLLGEEIKKYTKQTLAQTLSVVLTDKVSIGNLNVETLISMGRYPYTDWWGNLSDVDKKKIEEAIELTDTGHLRNKKIVELSDGEKQKVMIARALTQDTPLVFLDEATAHLDLPGRVEIMSLLKNLAHEIQKTILISTHELDLALQFADKLWLMSKEEGCVSGVPEDLVLEGTFEKVFRKKGFFFDKNTASFKVHQNKTKEIQVIGEENQASFWLKRALERVGYSIRLEETSLRVEVASHDSQWIFRLDRGNESIGFNNIETLIAFLKC